MSTTDSIPTEVIKTLYKAMVEDPRGKMLTTGEHWFMAGCAMGAEYVADKTPDVPTTRDLIAAQVLPEFLRAAHEKCSFESRWRENLAKEAYKLADAMVKARES